MKEMLHIIDWGDPYFALVTRCRIQLDVGQGMETEYEEGTEDALVPHHLKEFKSSVTDSRDEESKVVTQSIQICTMMNQN